MQRTCCHVGFEGLERKHQWDIVDVYTAYAFHGNKDMARINKYRGLRSLSVVVTVLVCGGLVGLTAASPRPGSGPENRSRTGQGILAVAKRPSAPIEDEGAPFPDVKILVPTLVWERQHLGLDEGKTFKIDDIRAEAVVIILFSTYCIPCRRDMSNLNAMAALIDADPKLNTRMKILAIGIGNTRKEIQRFRETMDIRFPMVPDYVFRIHEALGQLKTPAVLFVDLTSESVPTIRRVHVGPIGNAEPFVAQLASLLSCADLTSSLTKAPSL
jgi:peroxiredoxin